MSIKDTPENIILKSHEFLTESEAKAPEQVFFHRWFTTIIPFGPNNQPLVVNYCPNCRKTYSQAIAHPYQSNSQYGPPLVIDTLDLPREGCEGRPLIG